MINKEYDRKRYGENPSGLTGGELAESLQESDLYIANMELNSPKNRKENLDPITWHILWSALSYTMDHYPDFIKWLKGPTSEEKSRFKVMKIGGKIVLFTSDRLDREKLPENLYVYECRHADSGDMRTPATIENHVKVNFCGTMLSKEPIGLTKSEYGDYREITIFDKVAYKQTMSLEEYIKDLDFR